MNSTPYFPISIGFEMETNDMSLVHEYSKNHLHLPKFQFKQRIISRTRYQQDYELYCYNDQLVEWEKMHRFREKINEENPDKQYLIISPLYIDNIYFPFNDAEFVMTFFKIKEVIHKGQEKLFIAHYLFKALTEYVQPFLDPSNFSIHSLQENADFPYSFYLSKPNEKYGFLSTQKKIDELRFQCQCTVGLPLSRVIDFLFTMQPTDPDINLSLLIIDYIDEHWIDKPEHKITKDSAIKGFLFLFIMNGIFNTYRGRLKRKDNRFVVRASFFQILSLFTIPREKEIIISFFHVVKEKLKSSDETQDDIKMKTIRDCVHWQLFEKINQSSQRQRQIQSQVNDMRMVTRIFPNMNPEKMVYIEIRNLQRVFFESRAIRFTAMVEKLSTFLQTQEPLSQKETTTTQQKKQELEQEQQQPPKKKKGEKR